ncbi:unnamed protein product, partial [Staurois parvus]
MPPASVSATPMPHISAHLSCLSVHLSVPVSAAYQCLSVLPNSASQCHLTVSVSDATYQCHLSVPYMS